MPSPYAVTAEECIRRYDEPADPYRSALQRDRDRVIHCTAFRRLDYKTQVFVPHEHDHFRTRLTHSLEVAQVARDLGRALELNEDLCETVALAHDLGHPPFGHGGEAVLNELMMQHGYFEHNRQSLRIVDFLEHPYPDFRGLNLTQPTRECLARHETRYDTPACEEFAGPGHAPLEGQLVDLADEIAYTSADTEDALTAGWISAEDLGALALWQRAWAKAEQRYPDARTIHKRIRATKNIIGLIGEDLITISRERIAAMEIDSSAAARTAPHKAIALSATMRQELTALQDFLMERVYRHRDTMAADRQGRAKIRELFRTFCDTPTLLPARYQARIDEQGLPRVVCDYIAGMTDRYCHTVHAQLCGPTA